jgi:hypothetical protein
VYDRFIHEAHFRRRSAPFSHIHPSLRSDVDLLCPLSTFPLATGQAFTIFARRPRSRLAIPARLRRSGGKASVRLVFGLRASVRYARNSLHATSPAPPTPGFTHARGKRGERSSYQSIGIQPLLALLATLSVCLDGALQTQERTLRPKQSCPILRRQPARLRRAGSRLFFVYRRPLPGEQPSPDIRPSLRSDVDLLCPLSALLLATGQAFTIVSRSLPGERRASEHSCH